MSFDDEFGGLFDRESVLAGGVPARRANTVLFLIENRTAHLMAQSRQAADPYLSQEAAEQRELAFLEAFALGDEPPLRPKIQDLERYAPQWSTLVPRNPRIQAAIAHRLGEKYEFPYGSVWGSREALGLDDAAVQQAYQRLYRQPLESIFARRATPGDRLRWAWASLAGWIENLPPFWTAFALTLTEILGMTLLALPIALAGIGPLAGVALLVVLGMVNVLTVAFMSEAVARSGTIRYGSGFIGRVVDDYLGRAGSVVLSLGIFVICLLALQAFYIGFSTALEGATRVPALVWVALLFLVGLYFVRRESLNATVASALVVGAVNVVVIIVLSLVALVHVQPANLLYVNVPFLGGRPFDSAILGLVFGVVLAAYFGHLTVSTCARVVLQSDPSGRSLIRGTAAAQVTAILLYCLFVIGVNGAIAPQALSGALGTALDPMATEIGPIIYVLGSVFIVLGMGMGSIQYSLILFSLTRERLPSMSSPVLLLSRRKGLLLFRGPRRTDLRLGLVYLGLGGGGARFRMDVESNGNLRRVETTTPATSRWEILGENGDPNLIDRLPELQDLARARGVHLSLEILDADQQAARLQVTSSMRPVYEGTPDTAGLDMAGVFELSDSQAGLIGWIVRQGTVSLAEAAEYTEQSESKARTLLEDLAERGFVTERTDPEGQARYEARLATRRGRQGTRQLWQALSEESDSPSEVEVSRSSRASGTSALFQRLSSSKYGSFLLAFSPVVVAFLFAEWLLLTGSGSFTELLSFIGVIVVPLLGGVFPVLLLFASRRKGERVPTAVYRFLGNPVLLTAIYALFLASILVHGLVIWTDPLQRILAVATSVVVVVMTIAMRRAFVRRTIVELRKDEGEKVHFSITEAGSPAVTAVQLTYPDGERCFRASAGEIPAFSSLQQATFSPEGNASGQLKVWAHKVTPEGDSEGMAGLLRVRQGDETRQFDLKLSKGQVMLPLAHSDYQVDISLAGSGDARSG
ncbi:MAG: hypothetical protein ACRDTR_04315 [Rubrobacter sp.]